MHDTLRNILQYIHSTYKGSDAMNKKLPPIDFPIDLTAVEVQKLAQRYAGKLLLRNEIIMPHKQFEHLLANDFFIITSSIKQTLFTNQCQRCGNKKRSLFGMIACSLCQKTHLYCRKCIEMGRIMACEPLYYWSGPHPIWPRVKKPCIWDGQLTENQSIASQRIVAAIETADKELLIWGVCGSGKSEMLFAGISKALLLDKRICIATPRADVVRELLPRFKQVFPNIPIRGLYGGSRDNTGTSQFIISTTHQLFRFKNAFDVIIIDEIDAFPYHADPSLPYATKRATKKIGTTIYLTATPRKEQKNKIQRNILPHVFIPIRYHGHPLPVPKFQMCFTLQKSLDQSRPPDAFLTWFKQRRNKQRQCLIFVPTINLATKMKREFLLLFPKENIVSVHAKDDKREEKIRHFRQRKYSLLITTTILERGVTFPAIDVVVFDAGHTVFDEAALVQIAGRAGRSADDPTGEVIFFHDGKTKAMVQAVKEIVSMNKRGGFH